MTRSPERADSALTWTARVPTLAVFLAAAIVPFEVPLLQLGAGVTVTTVEAACLLAVGATLAAHAAAGRAVRWRTPITWAALSCLLVFACAALLAPSDRANAIRFVLRMAAAGAVCLVTLNTVTTPALARAMVKLLLAVGVIVSIGAVLEAAEVRAVLDALTLFRPGFHVVGGQLRATSTLFYPTIASMYLEVVFVLGLWLLLDPPDRSRRSAAFTLVALTIVGAGITATFTRAGLIGMAVALVLVALLRYAKLRRVDGGHLALAILGALLVALVLLSRSPDVLITRLRTGGSGDWYGATYAAPAALRLQTGGTYQVPVTVVNTGRLVWDSIFSMSYHWLRADTGAVVEFDGWRTPFPSPVDPNASVTLPVNVTAPGDPGNYVLVWDVVHEHRAWLSTEGVAPARTVVQVEGPAVPAVTTTALPRLPGASRRAERVTLWRTAVAMAAERPLLGVGPDNFRTTYGRYLGWTTWDTRVHANNMYLEVLAGAGVLGLGVLLWLVAAGGLAAWRMWRHAAGLEATAPAVLCAAWVTIAGHGLVDSFLSFTSTYVLFALVAGLALSPALGIVNDADRV